MNHTLETRKLSFGAPVNFIDVPGDPLLNFDIFIKSGYQFSQSAKYETSHILEHCLFEKNKHFTDPKGLKIAIETLGAYNNGTTSYSQNQYMMQGTVDKYKDTVSLLLKLVHDSILDEGVFLKEIEVIKNELTRAKNDYKRELSFSTLSYLKKGVQNYEQRLKNLDNVKFHDMVEFYDDLYSPSNCNFIISGGISGKQDEIMQELEGFYAGREKGLCREADYGISDDYGKKVSFIEVADKTNYDISLRFVIKDKSPDLSLLLPFPVGLFMDGMASRIQSKAREAGLIYTLGGSCFAENEYVTFGFSESISEDKILPLIKMIIDELRDILAGNVSDEEIERAKGYLYGHYVRNYVSGGKLANFYKDMLINGETFIGFNEFLELIKSYKREDLKIFEEKMDFSKWIFGIVGKNAKEKSEEIKGFLEEYAV